MKALLTPVTALSPPRLYGIHRTVKTKKEKKKEKKTSRGVIAYGGGQMDDRMLPAVGHIGSRVP